ncbi:MAG: hypothetical protein ABJB47_21045, partial [Actinomycetota bacterium]
MAGARRGGVLGVRARITAGASCAGWPPLPRGPGIGSRCRVRRGRLVSQLALQNAGPGGQRRDRRSCQGFHVRQRPVLRCPARRCPARRRPARRPGIGPHGFGSARFGSGKFRSRRFRS